MVEIFKISGKRIVFFGLLLTVIGMVLLGYHIIIYNLIMEGKLPPQQDSITTAGSLLLMIGPWIIKGRSIVKTAVN